MSVTDLIILGYLNKQSMHGYEILTAVKQSNLHIRIGIKLPSIYKCFPRLEKLNYICGEQITEGNNPPRRVFTITEQGKESLHQTIKEYLTNVKNERHEFWLAMVFMERTLSRQEFVDAINQRINNIDRKLQKTRKGKSTTYPDNVIPFNIRAMLKMGNAVSEAELKVLKDILSDINNPDNNYLFK